ncbi:MAG: ATP-binding protein [bacterium]|jgi:two-component system NtrC family sensor kinase|nr:MAG: hypothetical protein DIU52_07160 [bacterium]
MSRAGGAADLEAVRAELEAQQAELEQLLEEVTAQRNLLEQREAELLEERRRGMAAFRAIGRLVRASRDLGALARLLANVATELVRARGACIVLPCGAGMEELEVVGGGGIAEELEGRRFPAEGSISTTALRSETPRLVSGAEAAPVFAGFIEREKVERILVTAIVCADGRPGGALLVMDPQDASEDAVETLSALADQAGAGLESLRRAEEVERQRKQSRLMVAAMGRMRAGVLITDGKSVVRYANHAAAVLFGCRRASELLGQNVEDLYGADLPPTARRKIRAAALRSRWTGELLIKRRDGTLAPVHLTRVAVRNAGKVLGTVVIARDVTKEMQRQARFMESDRLALVGGLVSGVAHELNNPLGAISNFAELLLSGNLDPDSREMVETIGREARRAGEIVRNLLGFARRSETTRREVSLADIVNRTLALRVYDQRRNRIEVVLDLPPDLPEVWGDANQLQQVLLNLIVNAEQAIGQDGRITIRGRAAGKMVELVVEDTGPGIPPSALPRLFEPFYTSKPNGTGLGLAITHRIVTDHGGTIEACNVDGSGARFTVTLPRVVTNEPSQ